MVFRSNLSLINSRAIESAAIEVPAVIAALKKPEYRKILKPFKPVMLSKWRATDIICERAKTGNIKFLVSSGDFPRTDCNRAEIFRPPSHMDGLRQITIILARFEEKTRDFDTNVVVSVKTDGSILRFNFIHSITLSNHRDKHQTVTVGWKNSIPLLDMETANLICFGLECRNNKMPEQQILTQLDQKLASILAERNISFAEENGRGF